ncbi:hypothetical protein K9M79_07905 [Candidatus Woesearchaeota archaeon]|nr:hypothetical protein [Candidatus Woesearchaeota archaeon]
MEKEPEVTESLETAVEKEPIVVDDLIVKDHIETEIETKHYKIDEVKYEAKQDEPIIKKVPEQKLGIDPQDAFDTALNPATDQKLRVYKKTQQEEEKKTFEENYRRQHEYDIHKD